MNKPKNWAQKHIARLMAFTLSFGYFASGASPWLQLEQAHANALRPINVVDSGMIVGGAGDLAPNDLGTAPTEQMRASFVVPDDNTGRRLTFWMPTPGGSYQQVSLDVTRTGNTVDVYYHLFNEAGVAVDISQFSIWNNTGTPQFVPVAEFFNAGAPRIFYTPEELIPAVAGVTGVMSQWASDNQFDGDPNPGFTLYPSQVGAPVTGGAVGEYYVLADPWVQAHWASAPIPSNFPPNATHWSVFPVLAQPAITWRNYVGPTDPIRPYSQDVRANHGIIRNRPSGVALVVGQDVNVPAFRISGNADGTNGNGFSFLVAGRTVHLRFDGEELHFASDGFLPGYIFELELHELTLTGGQVTPGTPGTPGSSGAHLATMPIMTGVDIDNVIIIPFANGNRTATSAQGNVFSAAQLTAFNAAVDTDWQLTNLPVDRRFNNLLGEPNHFPSRVNAWDEQENVWPGQEQTGDPTDDGESGLVLQVPVPRYTNPASSGNLMSGPQHGAPVPIPVNFQLQTPAGAAVSATMTVTNILDDVYGPVSSDAEIATLPATGAVTHLLLRWTEIPPSTILAAADLTFSTDFSLDYLQPMNRAPVMNDIHTFLQFEIIRTPVGYAITVPAEHRYQVPGGGQYRLLSHTYIPGDGPGTGMQSFGDAQDIDNVPWANVPMFPLTQPHQNRFYYLQFRSSPTSRIIESQRLVFIADPTAVYIDIPLYFETTAVHNRMPGNMEGDRGILELGLSWDMGAVNDIVRLFNNHAEQVGDVYEFVIDYELLWDFNWNQAAMAVEGETDATGVATTIRTTLRARQLNGLPFTAMPIDVTNPAAVAAVNFELEHVLLVDGVPVAEQTEGNIEGTDGFRARMNIHEDFTGPLLERNPQGTLLNNLRYDPSAIGERFMANLTLEVDTMLAGSIPALPTQRPFQFPYVYFLRMMPVRYWSEGSMTDLTGEFPSQFSSITVGGFGGMQVPPPQNVQIDNQVTTSTAVGHDRDQISFDVSFALNPEAIRNFIENSHGLAIANPLTDVTLELTLYISQNEELMTDLLETGDAEWDADDNQVSAATRDLLAELPRHAFATVVPFTGDLEEGTYTLYFSDIEDATGLTVGGVSVRDILRSEPAPAGVVAVTGITLTDDQWAQILFPTPGQPALQPITITIDGLDENENYFVTMDAIVTQVGTFTVVEDGVTSHEPIAVRNASVFSNLSGIVTDGIIQIPDAADQYPPAPVLRIPNHGMDYAVIEWNRIPRSTTLDTDNYVEVLDYELIRVRAPQPTVSFMNNRATMTYLWPMLYPDHAPAPEGLDALSIMDSHQADAQRVIERWNGTAWVTGPDNITFTGYTTYNQTTGAGVVSVRDNDLQANTVYFYYVRTVRRIFERNADGTRGAEPIRELRSIFNNITVTTRIAGAPMNLIIEGEGGPNNLPFDRQSEVVISFLAPIGNLANLAPDNIRLQYQIQTDNGDWGEPQWLRESFLLQPNNHEQRDILIDGEYEPWHWFLYHITEGIVPNLMHGVRVRTVQILPGANSYSMWSNIGQWISDPDRQEAEYDRIERDWVDQLRRELNDLLRSPYWTMRRDNQANAVVLRPSMFSGDFLRSAIGGQINLPFNLAAQTVYYIPAQSFLQATTAEASWNIQADRMRITMPSATIDMANNSSVLTMNQAIRDRAGDIADYFVRMNVNWSIVPEVHGQPTLTQSAHLSLALVPAYNDIQSWEQDTLAELEEAIDDIIERYAYRLREGVRGYADNFELQRTMLDTVEAAVQEFMTLTRNNFSENQHSRGQLPVSFDRPVMMSATAGDGAAAVEPFTFVGGMWARIATTFDHGAGALVASSAPVVFTGREINIPGLSDQPNAHQTIGIVARHGLDEFFGTGHIDTGATANRGQLIGSVARMLGAPRGTTNPNAWLRDQGVSLPAGNATAPLSTQEALHLTMLVYSAQTRTAIDSIRITNFGATANVQGLNPAFATSFRAAVELGLYPSASPQPTTNVTIGTLLDLLTNLDSLIGL